MPDDADTVDAKQHRPAVCVGVQLCGQRSEEPERSGGTFAGFGNYERGALKGPYLVLRRWRLGMWDPSRALEVVPKMRRLVRRVTTWHTQRWEDEVERCAREVANWAPPATAPDDSPSQPKSLTSVESA